MMGYNTLIVQFRDFANRRLENYFLKKTERPIPSSFSLEGDENNPVIATIVKHQLNDEEQILLMMALVPHLDPGFYSSLIQKFLPNGGDFPVFGGVKGKHHRGLIPTGETAMFLISGVDLENRLEVVKQLKKSVLMSLGILDLEAVAPGEPEMSGKLILTKDYAELFLTGSRSFPTFGADFPAQKIETALEWNDLVLADEVILAVKELQTWIEYNDRLMNDWQMWKKLRPGYLVLFYGPSGTGKTLTASLLGKYTDRPVFRVDLSTIVSKYIGETEKNLEKLFSKAENQGWILFFDEADALFGRRTEVSDSHDRFANQEVSYLLQRVENFSGMVILSTNYKSNMDEAFVRRFNSIIRFPFPNVKMREKLWKSSFPKGVRYAPNVDMNRIASTYKLAGGSIINVVHHACLKMVSRNEKTIHLEDILQGIKHEVEKEGKIFSSLTPPKVNGQEVQKGL